MATLRDSIGINTSTGQGDLIQDQNLANGMGSLRRGFAAGRIGNELNPLRTDLLEAEIAGDQPRAQSLRDHVGALERRQAMYAPEVGRLEDINGVGDALSYGAGQVGQGAASLLDPVAVSAGLNAAGTGVSMIPHPMAKAAGMGLRGAGVVVPGLMSKQQLTGEFIGEAQQDPALMARTSPQDLRDMAGNYGALAAIPDSFLPGVVGRQLGGAGLRAGIGKLGAGTRAALGTVGEGFTEGAQAAGSQFARGQLNPDRDTSGDNMDILNNAVGGAVGGAPVAGAGALADAGFRRTGTAADQLGAKAGETFDLLAEKAGPAIAKAKSGVIDLMADEDGKVSYKGITEKLHASAEGVISGGGMSDEDMQVLSDVPPEHLMANDDMAREWINANGPRRGALVVDKLKAMAEDDDAQALLQRAAAEQDPVRQQAVIDEAAQYLIANTPSGRGEARAEKLASFAGAAGALLGKAGMALGKGALAMGKATMEGVKEGAKKNAQADEDFASWRDRVYGVDGKTASNEAMAKGASYAKAADFSQRADLAAGYAADMAKRGKVALKGGQALARHAAFNLAEMIDSVGSDTKRTVARMNRVVADFKDLYKANAPAVLKQLGAILGPDAGPAMKHMLGELEQQMSPSGRQYVQDSRAALAEQVVGLIGVPEQMALMKEGINLREPKQAAELLGLMEDFADGMGVAPGMRAALNQRFGKEGVEQIMGVLNGQAEKEQPGPVVDDRDEIADEFEQKGQEKNVARGSGPKVYGFGNGLGLRTNGETRDPFASTEKLSAAEREARKMTGEDITSRPSLFKKGQQLFGGKGDAIEARIADIKKQLQEDPEYPDHDNHDVRAHSAHDVMKASGMQPGKVLQLYRDYGLHSSEKDPEVRAAASDARFLIAQRMHRDAQKAAVARGERARGRTPIKDPDLRAAEERFVTRMSESYATGELDDKLTPYGKPKLDAATQERMTLAIEKELEKELTDKAEAYFKERFVVVGEQLSNRDPSKIAVTEVLEMHKAGQLAMERARLAADPDKAVSDANLLVFKSDSTPKGEVTIPAGKLVNWVRKQRADSEPTSYSNTSKDAAYLADVSEGIAALVGSGYVKGMPYKLNDLGQQEHFGKGHGIAPSLRLATKTYAGMQKADQMRREKREGDTITERDDEAVAAEQAQGEEAFVADPLEVVEPGANGERFLPEREDMTKGDLGRPTMSRDGKYEVNRSGRRNPTAKTSKDEGVTPLDFFPAQEPGAVPDDFADQQYNTRMSTARFEGGPEPRMSAVSRARFRAEELMAGFAKDPEGTTERMMARLRTAKRPAFSNAGRGAPGAEQVVGGAHYIAPIAHLVQRDRVAGMKLSQSEQEMFDYLRRETASVLLNAPEAELSKTQVLNIAQMMSTDPRKVNPGNVMSMLATLAARSDTAPVVAKQEPAAPKANIMGRAISQRQAYLDNPPADYSAEKGRAIASWAKEQLTRVNAEQAKTTDTERKETLSDYKAGLERLVTKAAEMAEGDASLADFEGTAPEVANAGLPKGQATLSGARNAQAGGHFDANTSTWVGAGPSRVSTQAEHDEATAYAAKVLGPKIKVEFKAITGYSGEFIDATNTIEISTTAAAGTLGTLYHEAMHVFFRDFVKGNPQLKTVFGSLVNDPKHMDRLQALLKDYPAALAQLSSGEERLAYTYQFWKAGLLQVDTKANTVLQKVGKFFRRVLGMVRDSERALELFQAFDNGKMSEPSAAGKVIAKAMSQGGSALKLRRNLDGVVQGLAALTMPAAEVLGQSLSPTARKLSTMLFTNPGDEEHGHSERGMLNARRSVGQQYSNLTNRLLEDLSESDHVAVQKYLQTEADPATIPLDAHRVAVKGIRAALDRFHLYLTESGLKIGKVENYYPVVWNMDALLNKKAEFINMLVTKYAAEMTPVDGDAAAAAERIWTSLVNREGVDAHLPAGREDGVLSPFFASQEMRTLPWLKGADREAFLDKNMPMTLSRYFQQGAHSAEYFRRFGENGTRLDDMLMGTKVEDDKGNITRLPDGIIHELGTASREKLARGEIANEPARAKWVSRQMRDISKSVGAMEGALGKDVSPTMRSFNSWMAVYQNVRLLPMSLFSSFVDPLALVARGAPMSAAYESFMYGMREVFRTWGDAFRDMPPERRRDEWAELAEHIGASEVAMFSHHVADEYSSTYMTAGAKKINDKMFVLNGMEAWNRGSRIMATKWAVRFIEKHAALPDKIHSERWLKELGLTPKAITLDNGMLVTSRHELAALKGISLEQATHEIAPIHAALNRWVEGAVLTPNAAQRPAWSSDPHWATFFHLKQFSYSFHQTILKRAVNEFKHGNMAPVGALAMFVPTMITADVMKGLIQGGGELPAYMKGMDAGDWFMHGAQRAGLGGIGTIGMDAGVDPMSLGGPAVEQLTDGMRDGFGGKTMLKAMPLNALYGQMFQGASVPAPG